MRKFCPAGIIYKLLLAAAIILSAVGLLRYTDTVMETGKNAALMCLEVILPSLFPFFVVSNLIIGLGFAEIIGRLFEPLMRRLFNVNGACAPAFILGIIGGYPVGAKTAIALYEKKLCTKTEAERLLSFCNNSGPAFIFGVVGAGIFASSRAGLLLYAAHIAASTTVGLLFRFYKRGDRAHAAARPDFSGTNTRLAPAFVASVQNAFQSVINISAFVIFFAVGVNMLFTAGILTSLAEGLGVLLSPLGLKAADIRGLLTGIMEITSGLWTLSGAGSSLTARLSLAAFLLGWAGISVHCQVLSFIGGSGLSLKPYLFGKLLQAVLSTVYIYILTLVLPSTLPTTQILLEQVSLLAYMDFKTAFASGLFSALLAAAALLVPLVFSEKTKKYL